MDVVLEQDVEGWALTRGTSALGLLLVGNRQRDTPRRRY